MKKAETEVITKWTKKKREMFKKKKARQNYSKLQ